MVVASLATHPERYTSALHVIQHVAPQVDRLHVYVNDNGEPSPWMKRTPSNAVPVLGSEASGDMADVGKFWPFESLSSSVTHLTLDDDLAYPDDYVERTLHHLDALDGRAVISYHGCRLPNERVDSYYKDGQRDKVHFRQAQEQYTPMQVLGTGLMAYEVSTVRFPKSAFLCTHMADLWAALRCAEKGVPRVVAPHEKDWITPLDTENASIYQRFYHDDAPQTCVINDHDFTLLTVT